MEKLHHCRRPQAACRAGIQRTQNRLLNMLWTLLRVSVCLRWASPQNLPCLQGRFWTSGPLCFASEKEYWKALSVFLDKLYAGTFSVSAQFVPKQKQCPLTQHDSQLLVNILYLQDIEKYFPSFPTSCGTECARSLAANTVFHVPVSGRNIVIFYTLHRSAAILMKMVHILK